jgi:hypothetical protein
VDNSGLRRRPVARPSPHQGRSRRCPPWPATFRRRGAVTQYYRAGLQFDTLSSMFITHLHADHLADYYSFFILEGWGPSGDSGDDVGIRPQVQVYGPGSAGALPPA